MNDMAVIHTAAAVTALKTVMQVMQTECDDVDIHFAYACRKLSLRFHPDKAAADEKEVATAVFVLIKAAAEEI